MSAHVAGKHEIETSTGCYLDLENPNPDHIHIEDIARGLGLTARFGGQTNRFYSVAQHACLVSERLALIGSDLHMSYAGLHHDDPEAYLGDIQRPLKSLLPEYRLLEERLARRIEWMLNPKGPFDPEDQQIKDVDLWALSYEAYHLMVSKGRGWKGDGIYKPGEDLDPGTLHCWDADIASERYLIQHQAFLASGA